MFVLIIFLFISIFSIYFFTKNKKRKTTINPLLNLDYYKTQKINFKLSYTNVSRLIGTEEDVIYKRINQILYKNGDEDTVKTIIKTHGIFSDNFIVKFYSERIKDLNSKTINQELKSFIKYRTYVNDASRKMKDIILTRIGEQKIQICINEFIKTTKNKRKCIVCGRFFEMFKLPYWVYYGSNANVNTCFECPVNKNPNDNEIKLNINKLIDYCGFIPNASFSLWSNPHTERIEKDKWKEVYIAYLNLGGVYHIEKKYGSWFNALVENDVFPNGIQKTPRGYRCIADSGNSCNSLAEMHIDNYLYKSGFDYEKEPMYPKHPIFNKSGRMRADWKVKNTFVEYFGLQGDKDYDIKTQKKIELCKEKGIKLLPIYPKDIKNIKDIFNKELPK